VNETPSTESTAVAAQAQDGAAGESRLSAVDHTAAQLAALQARTGRAPLPPLQPLSSDDPAAPLVPLTQPANARQAPSGQAPSRQAPAREAPSTQGTSRQQAAAVPQGAAGQPVAVARQEEPGQGATHVLVPEPAVTLTGSDLPVWARRLAVFDLETTGIDVETCRVVTANVSIIDENGDVEVRQDWIADPGVEIPEQAAAVHGVTTERARAEGRAAAEVVAEIVETLRHAMAAGIAVVAYNAPYDFTLLNRDAVRHGIAPLDNPGPIIDPLVIDKAVDRFRKGKRTLEASAEFYGVSLTDAHDAGADAIAAGRVAQALARRYPEALALTAVELHHQQAGWFGEQALSFQDYMRKSRDPNFIARTEWPAG
jgi:DNA polymerase-3 subunit epsilon